MTPITCISRRALEDCVRPPQFTNLPLELGDPRLVLGRYTRLLPGIDAECSRPRPMQVGWEGMLNLLRDAAM